jgi:mannose-6-phosphate isomerase
MKLPINAESPKEEVLKEIKHNIAAENLTIVELDEQKPWGAYYRIDDNQIKEFLKLYFSHSQWDPPQGATLSPKFLIIAPHQRLSWQYHNRRAEIWKVVVGPVAIEISSNDKEPDPETKQINEVIDIKPGARHRLCGAENWGVVAEIWQHTDPDNLSNEEDIIHLQDDYGR